MLNQLGNGYRINPTDYEFQLVEAKTMKQAGTKN